MCIPPRAPPAGLKSGAAGEVVKVNAEAPRAARASLPPLLSTGCKGDLFRQPAGLSTHQFAGFGGIQGICKEKQKQKHELWPKGHPPPAPHAKRPCSPASDGTITPVPGEAGAQQSPRSSGHTRTWWYNGVQGGRNGDLLIRPAGTARASPTSRRAQRNEVRLHCFSAV